MKDLLMMISLLEVKMTATAEEKKEIYDKMQESGEDCPSCKNKDKCPIYDALML